MMTSRILVIEDNPASLDLMVYLLRAFGHTPLTARDGLQGIEVAKTERPELILCDVQLPGADGHEVCRQLKSDPVLRTIPLVAVTAYAMVGDREKLLDEGFNGYLSKPIQPNTFMDQVAAFLCKPNTHNLEPVPTTASVIYAKGKGEIMVVDNSPVNISLSRSMLEPFGYSIIAATSVNEALALMKETKPDAILSDVHMPDNDGFDFIRTVKSDPELSSIPFIFISSTLWARREEELGLSMGADSFVVRPIEPHALVAEIEAHRRTLHR